MSDLYAYCKAQYTNRFPVTGFEGGTSIVIVQMDDVSIEPYDGGYIVNTENTTVIFDQRTFYVDDMFFAEEIHPCLKLDGDFYII